MDLRAFYQKLKKIEQDITDAHVVIVSNETSDGGRAGQKSEVSRSSAARSILEGRARLATPDESVEFRGAIEQARQEAEQKAESQKIQVSVVSDSDLRALRNAAKSEKR